MATIGYSTRKVFDAIDMPTELFIIFKEYYGEHYPCNGVWLAVDMADLIGQSEDLRSSTDLEDVSLGKDLAALSKWLLDRGAEANEDVLVHLWW